jgi:toxin-antitoxin system PIN domain toxin
MMLLDVNLLLYANDLASPHHERTKAWAEQALSRQESVGLSWMTILGFLRISTHPRLPRPIPLANALAAIAEWLDHPSVSIVSPGERHWGIFRSLLPSAQARGSLIMDAHLAALAIEHGATVCTNDKGFARFSGVPWMNPLEA